MATGRTDEFRKEAVRIALTSGLSRRQVADDLGGGFSTLNKWVNAHRGFKPAKRLIQDAHCGPRGSGSRQENSGFPMA